MILLTRLRLVEVLLSDLVSGLRLGLVSDLASDSASATSILEVCGWAIISVTDSSILNGEGRVASIESAETTRMASPCLIIFIFRFSVVTCLPVTTTGVLESTSSSTGRFLERIRTEIFSGSPGFGKSWSATVLMSVSISPSSILMTRVA